MLVTVSAALVAAAVLFLVFRSAQGRITPPDRRAHRGDPPRPADRPAQPRGGGRHPRRGDRAGPRRGRARGRPRRHRQLPAAQRHPRACGRRPGAPGRRRLLQRRRGAVVGPLRPGRVPHRRPGDGGAGLEPLVERLRTASAMSASLSSRTERLPITVSVGIGTYPEHADRCTELCRPRRPAPRTRRRRAAATRCATPSAVEAAPASRPDVRRAPGPDHRGRHQGPLHEAPLRGRRPLRDVPRRAARARPERRSRTIGVAGLLHDVGKIGIPDAILRKPGQADRRGVRRRQAARRARRHDRPRPAGHRDRPGRHPPPPRALGRHRATSTVWPARRSRSSPGSSRSATRSRR